MGKPNILKYAIALYEAERGRKPIPPISAQDVSLTVADAYAVQLENVQRAIRMGETVSGKKIGLTAPPIQAQMGIQEPDYGHLFASMECGDGTIPTDRLIQPQIEAELAFVLRDNLSGGKITALDVRNATDYVVGAFEIMDCRIENWNLRLVDMIADNACAGRYVLGAKHLPIEGLDLSSVAMTLWRNGEQIQTGTGMAVMGDPCRSVAWLSNRLWYYGVPLKRGDVILSGAFTAAVPAQKGDTFRVEFSSFGEVEARFV